MTGPEFIVPAGYGELMRERRHYSQAVRIGPFLLVAGQGGWTPELAAAGEPRGAAPLRFRQRLERARGRRLVLGRGRRGHLIPRRPRRRRARPDRRAPARALPRIISRSGPCSASPRSPVPRCVSRSPFAPSAPLRIDAASRRVSDSPSEGLEGKRTSHGVAQDAALRESGQGEPLVLRVLLCSVTRSFKEEICVDASGS